MSWGRFNSQFRETGWERRERIRKSVQAARCPECGVGNSGLGTPHAETCSQRIPPRCTASNATTPVISGSGDPENASKISDPD